MSFQVCPDGNKLNFLGRKRVANILGTRSTAWEEEPDSVSASQRSSVDRAQDPRNPDASTNVLLREHRTRDYRQGLAVPWRVILRKTEGLSRMNEEDFEPRFQFG